MVIVTYGCHVASAGSPVISSEHRRAALVSPADVAALNMPDGYKRSVKTWFGMLASSAGAAAPPWLSENGASG